MLWNDVLLFVFEKIGYLDVGDYSDYSNLIMEV